MGIYLLINFVLGFFTMHLSAFLNDLITPFSKLLGPVIIEESLKALFPLFFFYKFKRKLKPKHTFLLPVTLALGFGFAEALNYFILLTGYKGYNQKVFKRILPISVHLIGSCFLGLSLYFQKSSKKPLWILGLASSSLIHYSYNCLV